MSQITEIVVCAAIVIGGVFILVGSYGLLKLDKPMSRLHAPTKASTLGVGSILAASAIYAFGRGEFSLHELLIVAFLFVTAPISANFIAKVAIHRGRITEDLPAPREDNAWATQDAPRNDATS
ncbi:Na+/H+ antiporter subunit G [Roseovarius salis]|uniref:Na+/H+ antiporter subunit G n=1 Tax=Roseovarius salis TaxID=3376063 RepID=UPI0037C7521B